MILVAVIIGIAVLLAVLAPFFVGAGGALVPAASETSPDRLQALRGAVVDRYLQDEAAHARKDISDRTWKKRREFLMHRYIDATRRLDFLQHEKSSKRAR